MKIWEIVKNMVTQKDLLNLKLCDVAKGVTTTGFIFQKNTGELIGFEIPTKKIEYCIFEKET